MSHPNSPFFPSPPGREPNPPEWCLRRDTALPMMLVGLALFISSR